MLLLNVMKMPWNGYENVLISTLLKFFFKHKINKMIKSTSLKNFFVCLHPIQCLNFRLVSREIILGYFLFKIEQISNINTGTRFGNNDLQKANLSQFFGPFVRSGQT